jgi:hypothetical protein
VAEPATGCWLVTFVIARAGLANDRFRTYWRDVHGPATVANYGSFLDWYSQHPSAAGPGEQPGGVAFMRFASRGVLDDMRDRRVPSDEHVFLESAATTAITTGLARTVVRGSCDVPNLGRSVVALALPGGDPGRALVDRLRTAADADGGWLMVLDAVAQVDPRSERFGGVALASVAQPRARADLGAEEVTALLDPLGATCQLDGRGGPATRTPISIDLADLITRLGTA